MAQKANLVIDQGSDYSLNIELFDINDNTYDLTNSEIYSQIRKNYASTTSIDFTAIIAGNPTLGTINLSLTNEQTNNLEPGRYLYDVEIKTNDGEVIRVLEGIVTVTPGITRTV